MRKEGGKRMPDFGKVLRQAQQLTAKISKLQETLAEKELEVSVGGEMVKVKVNGAQEILEVKLQPEIVNEGDIEMLEELIVAGVNEALRKSQEMVGEEINKLTGGLNFPLGFLRGIMK